MRPKRRQVVLITGASSGLGLSIAKLLLHNPRYFLVLTSRQDSLARFDEDELINATSRIWLRVLDMIDHNQITAVVNEINLKLGGVDILINNAGISERSTVEDSDDACRQKQLDVNYLAPFQLISQVLPSMRKKKHGRIVNVSSAGGFMAMPTMSAYSASKFALEAASESLWYEMRPWGIHVTLVIPGFINSAGYLRTTESRDCKRALQDTKSAYYEHYRGMKLLITKSMRATKATNETIARSIYSILTSASPPLRVHITTQAKLLYWLRKLTPPIFYHFLMYRLLPNINVWGKNRYRPFRQKDRNMPV